MPLTEFLISVVVRFGQILISPIKNPELLWIIIPIYINWIATDYFQERKGTDFGNAITNGVVTLWVGIDWLRQLSHDFSLSMSFFSKILLCILLLIYSALIIVECARARKIAHYIGRVREVSYFMIVLTPIVYGIIPIDSVTICAIALFFPIWYAIGEFIDRGLPAPPTEESEAGEMPELKDLGELSPVSEGPQGPQMPAGPAAPPITPPAGLPPGNF